MVAANAIEKYYISQAQYGGNIGLFYSGRKIQRGYGLSSFFGGLIRALKPIFIRGAKAVGKEAIRTGANIVGDIATSSDARPVKEIVRSRFREGKDNLITKAKRTIHEMTGSGIKRKVKRRRVTSCSQRVAKRRRTTFPANDIFAS